MCRMRDVIVMWIASALAWAPLHAQPAGEVLPAGLDRAVERGLNYLHGQQDAEKGSFRAAGPPNAMAGLAVLAFLGCGHTPDVGRYGLTVRKAVDFLLNQNLPDGYYGNDGGRMYGHCIVTIALAEVYGMETEEPQRRRIRSALENALKVIYAAQDVEKPAEHAGGWRYERKSADSDLSVSAWCMAAMKAAQNAGLTVPKERVDTAVRYMLGCYRKEQRGFAYMPGQDASASMTGAALLNLYLLGADARPEVSAAARFLLDKPVTGDTRYWHYATYYTTQAAFQEGGETWQTVWKRSSEEILRTQRQDGSWAARQGDPGRDDPKGRFFPTAMSVLTLSVPLRLLPIYQR